MWRKFNSPTYKHFCVVTLRNESRCVICCSNVLSSLYCPVRISINLTTLCSASSNVSVGCEEISSGFGFGLAGECGVSEDEDVDAVLSLFCKCNLIQYK